VRTAQTLLASADWILHIVLSTKHWQEFSVHWQNAKLIYDIVTRCVITVISLSALVGYEGYLAHNKCSYNNSKKFISGTLSLTLSNSIRNFGPIPWRPQTMTATRYTTTCWRPQQWKRETPTALLRNRQTHDIVGQSSPSYVFGRHGLWLTHYFRQTFRTSNWYARLWLLPKHLWSLDILALYKSEYY